MQDDTFAGKCGVHDLHRCGICATFVHMVDVASRDLRNHTADVLRRVTEGDRVTITVNGLPVAELIPPSTARRASMSRRELIALLVPHQADSGMRADLDALTDETTDDLEPPT
jgi:prevent-host-death family protein